MRNRYILFSLFFLLLATGIVHASQGAVGFRNSVMNATGYGVFFNSLEHQAQFTIKVNDVPLTFSNQQSSVDFQRLSNVSNRNSTRNNGFKYNLSVNFSVAQITTFKNLTFWFNDTKPFQWVGTGVVCVPFNVLRKNEGGQLVSYTDRDCFGFADLFNFGKKYGFKFNESIVNDFWNTSGVIKPSATNQSYYVLNLTNFSLSTPLDAGNRFSLDPTVDYFSSSVFSNGAFNQTYLNDSQSVFQTYYANNNTFNPQGQYFSQMIIINHTSPNMVLNTANWTWFEAAGLSATEVTLLSMHFENDTKDSSRFNNSGVRIGSPVFIPEGFRGQSLNFSGSGQYVNLSNSELKLRGFNYTISAWVKVPISTNTGDYQTIIDKESSSTDRNYWLGLSIAAGVCSLQHQPFLRVSVAGTAFNVCATSAINKGEWVQVTGTANYTALSIYINGTLEGTSDLSSGRVDAGNTQEPTIGFQITQNRYFQGQMDELHYFNRTFSASEVSQLYSWEKAGGTGNGGFIHNFTNVSMAFRSKNYSFDDTNLTFWVDLGDSSDNETFINQTLDIAGNNKGTFSGPLGLNTTSAVIGKSLEFVSAAQNEIKFVDNANLTVNENNFTIAAWINLRALAAGSKTGVFGTLGGDNGFQGYLIGIMTGVTCIGDGLSHVYLETYAGGLPNPAGCSNQTGTINILDTWYHIAVVRDKAKGQYLFYVNGTESGTLTDTITAAITNSQVPQIGVGQPSTTGGGNFFNGKIDDVKLWQRVLSGPEIKNLYNAGNPTASSGKESNFSSWSGEYGGGNATPNVQGNIIQYRANFNSSVNYSAFLQNVTLTYNPPSGAAGGAATTNITVYLNTPATTFNTSSSSLTFNFKIDLLNQTVENLTNASVWLANTTALPSGVLGVVWGLNQTVNTSALINASFVNNIAVNGLSEGRYVWNVNGSTKDAWNFAATNFTFTIDKTNPLATLQVYPTNATNVSSRFIAFQFTPKDALTGAVNSTLYVYNSTGFIINSSFNGTFTNGTTITNGINFAYDGYFNWTVMACDYVGLCSNTTFGNFTLDTFNPNYFRIITPANNSYVNASWVNITFEVGDQLSLPRNTTVWVINISNGFYYGSYSNLTVTNGTGLTYNFSSVNNGSINITVQSCDWTGNCVNLTRSWFVNINITVPIVPSSSAPVVTLITPIDFYNSSSRTQIFNFTPNSTDGSFGNATLWANFSGVWQANNTNGSLLINGSQNNNITVNGLSDGRYVWNVRVCDANGCNFAAGNRTLTIDTKSPSITLTQPGNLTNISATNIVFLFTPTDSGLTGTANTTLYVFNVTSGQIINVTTNLSVLEGGQITVGLNLLNRFRYNWTVMACDYAGNCANASNQNFTVDTENPDFIKVTSPANNSYFTNQIGWVNSSWYAGDNFSLIANTTVWAINNNGTYGQSWFNSTGNGTLIYNNFSGLGNGTWFFTYQLCDYAGNCINYSRFTRFDMNNTPAIAVVPASGDIFNICSDGTYKTSKAGQFVFYLTNLTGHFTGATCNVDVINQSSNLFVFKELTATEIGRGWYNTTLNFTAAGAYAVSYNCSLGSLVIEGTRSVKVSSACSGALLFAAGSVPFNNSNNVNGNMLDFILTFGTIAAVMFLLYYWMRREHKEISEKNKLGEGDPLPFVENLNKMMAFGMGITSLAFMFGFAWLGYPMISNQTMNYNYSNLTVTSGDASLVGPFVTTASGSNTANIPTGANNLALAGFEVLVGIGFLILVVYIVSKVVRTINKGKEEFQRKQQGDFDGPH